MTPFLNALSACPLVAILRGLPPEHAAEVGLALYDAGFRCIEVPLNSPQPMKSIATLAKTLPADCLVGAGTVMSAAQVTQVADAGGRLIVLPHSDPQVIFAAKAAGLACAPGVATPNEAFAALANGADAIKLFPAEMLPPQILKAWRAVLPPGTVCIPVGGVRPDNMAAYWEAGARGFGLGLAIYTPQTSTAEVAANARRFVAVAHTLAA